MPKQPAFPGLRDAMKKKQTRRELFLGEMEAVVPWARLLALIERECPTFCVSVIWSMLPERSKDDDGFQTNCWTSC